MRYSFIVTLLLSASVASACATEPDLLQASHVVGVWNFSRTTPSGCAPNLVVTISEAREVAGNTFNLSGSWRPSGSTTAETHVTGNLSRLTRDFEIIGPGEKLEGTLFRDGAAIAQWESASCTDELSGAKTP